MAVNIKDSHQRQNSSEIGQIARELLDYSEYATVYGKTSRGIFLKLSCDWIVFLSFERHRGPLILNIIDQPITFNELEIGSLVSILPDRLFFSSIDHSINLEHTEKWQVPDIRGDSSQPSNQIRLRIFSILQQAAAFNINSQLVSMLVNLLIGSHPTSKYDQDTFLRLESLLAASEENRIDKIAEYLESFLGWGGGLTPSGDDLVTGFLLAANRWGEVLGSIIDKNVLNSRILSQARLVTSLLSTNLIECATLGQAEERLILALDGIITGYPDVDECAYALSSWGSTSGFDMLVGIFLFMHSIN